jgi:hypothetical protein
MSSEQSPLPDLFTAEWDDGQVAELFDDLSRGADVRQVQIRAAAKSQQPGGAATLDEARQRFINRTAVAIQIYYEFESQVWCDTLMIGPQITKIIRTRQ